MIQPITTTPPEGNSDVLTLLKEGEEGEEKTLWLLQTKEDHYEYRYEFDASVPMYMGFNPTGARYRLSSIKDPSGNTVTLTYNADGTIDSLTDAAGRVTSFVYDGSKHCTSITLPNGKTASYSYDSKGNLKSTTDFAGNVASYTYDADNYLTRISSGGKTWSFTYSGAPPKKIQTVTDALGKVTTYSKSGSIVTATDPLGGQSTYTHYGTNLTHSKNPLNLDVHRFVYSGGQAVEFKDPLGYKTQWTYDAKGNMTSQTGPKSSEVTTFSYDLSDNLTGITDAYTQNWGFEYDASHRLVKKTSPLGHITNLTYAANGLLTGLTDANSKSTSYAYDGFGNLQTLTDPLGNVTTFAYDASGFDKTSVTDARGNTWQFFYDDNRRLTQVTNPDGTLKSLLYDCCAPTGITDENGHSTLFQNNAELLTVAITDPMGKVTQYSYTSDKRLASVTDPLGRTTSFAYDAAGRLTQKTDPSGGSVSRTYDANGNLSSVTDERGKKTEFFYDVDRRLEKITDPLGRTVRFNRDLLGRIVTMYNARFEMPTTGVIAFTYDADGRKTAKRYFPTTVASYQYDNTDKLIGFTDAIGQTTYTRDALGRITRILYPDGGSLYRTYDAVGNVASVGYPNSLTVTYIHDNRNKVIRIDWGSNWMTNGYDNAGNLISATRSNGTRSDYVFDANNRITSIAHKKGGVSFAQMQYTRDANGAITGETNALPLLPSAQAPIACTYDDANQIVSCGGDAYTYDLDGNLTTITGSRTFSAVYDPENRPTAITRQGVAATYIYGATGRRVKAVTGGSTRNYHHDETGKLLYETDGSNQVTVYYVYNGDHLVAMTTAAGTTYVYHFDQLGNTVAMTDAGGNVVMAYVYAPFGEVVNQSGSLYNPFTFGGEYGVMDEGDGLFFMRNRYYDAVTGRFLHKDPIGFRGGLNLYAYVSNNPVSLNDPKGLQGTRWCGRFIETSDGQLVPNDPSIYPDQEKRMPVSQEEIDRSFNAACYLADKVIGATPFLGEVQGLAKSMGYSAGGDDEEAKNELFKTVTGPVGTVIDIFDDAGLWDGEAPETPLPPTYDRPVSESYHGEEIYY